MAKYVMVRKRGVRQDGHNYVAQCTVCSGSKQDVSGVRGVTKEMAQQLAVKHCSDYHDGHTTF